jgi:hypothetical protein
MSLADEADVLHRCLFSQPLDPSVTARYRAAHEQLFPAEETSATVARVVARRLDAEAVEFALRRRGAGGQLTRKMHILCYLVEVRSAYLPEFVNLQPGRARAVGGLAVALVRAGWKLIKGEYLVRRHGLL